MITDLDEIRRALAAATPGPWSQHVLNFVETGDCPSCEIDCSAAVGFIVVRPHLSDDGADGVNDAFLVANAPTWLAALCDEIERLRELVDPKLDSTVSLLAERDAALAEVDLLRRHLDSIWPGIPRAELDKWRACADKLYVAVDYFRKTRKIAVSHEEALAIYEQLVGES